MKIYTEPVTCSVCGGPGLARADHLWANWLGLVQHIDPIVCAENLRHQREELERRERVVQKIEECTAGEGESDAHKQNV